MGASSEVLALLTKMEALNIGARGLAETNAVAAVISAAQGKGPGDGICHCERGVEADGVTGKGSFVDWCHVLQVLVLCWTPPRNPLRRTIPYEYRTNAYNAH